jgi:ATP-dependent DNA helicase RecG
MSRDDITPALQISTEIIEIEGCRVVVAEIPPSPADQRPVYVTAQGISGGSYLRGGDGDRHMTESEIALIVGARVQPSYDREPVDGSTTDDLDEEAIRRSLRRLRSGFPKLAQSDDATVLFRLGITAGPSVGAPLTLAGRMTYGQFPQQFFPQLMVSVVVHSPDTSSGTRFLDNQAVRGSIPEMIETALSVLRRNLAFRAVISDRGGRVDEVE